ncbi:MAG: TetR/AcrR family transcriptional regulator [Actinomycetota bacterium]
MAQKTLKRPNSQGLSKDRIVEAAVALADEIGFESCSMRKLAEELDAAPMALYRHVASKEDLLDGMIDVVFAEIDVPSGQSDWKAELRQRAIETRAALFRHRWANGLMESRTKPGPANAAYHNVFMGCLREAGFPFRQAVHAYNAVQSYTYGFALQEKYLSFETAEESVDVARMTIEEHAAQYPYLAEVVEEFTRSGGYDYDEEFEIALDLILDSIEQFKDPGPNRN